MKKLYLAIGLIYILSGCTTIINSKDLYREPVISLLEVVFNYQFENNGSSYKKAADAFCIQVVNLTLDKQFMSRFSSSSPPVYSHDNCPETSKVVNFYVNKVSRVTSGRYFLYGGYYQGNVGSAENKYTLIKNTNGEWEVVKRKRLFIS